MGSLPQVDRHLNIEFQAHMLIEVNSLTAQEVGFLLSPPFVRRFDMPSGMG